MEIHLYYINLQQVIKAGQKNVHTLGGKTIFI